MRQATQVFKTLILYGALPALLLVGTAAPPAAAEDSRSAGARATRPSGSSAGGKADVRTPSAKSSSPRAVPRASGNPSPAGRTRQHTPGSTRRGGRSHHGYRHHPWHSGYSFWFGYRGFYPYYYGYWGPYYYPGYWGYPRYYRARSEYDLGALDLNVRPKKAEVFLDGQYVGLVKQFDGYPDYLWLEKGSHELTFYMPGYRTLSRRYSVHPGVVLDVRLELEPGESVPPEEVFAEQYSAAPKPAPRAGPEASADDRDYAAAPEEERGAAALAGQEPGKVRLDVEPRDASVYLDGRLLGSGSELAALHGGLIVDAGRHQLEVVRPGFEAKRLDFFLESAGEIELKVRLSES